MGQQYYYNPFAQITVHDGAVRDTIKKYQKKTNCTFIKTEYNVKTKAGVRHGSSEKQPLAGIEVDSTLLIDGHGNWTASRISVKTRSKYLPGDRGWLRITVDDLVTQLIFDGLPKGHVRIRLLSCYGGGLNPEDAIHDRSQAAAPFAKVLAMKLGPTHPNIVVGGYTGSVWVPPKGGHNEVFLKKVDDSETVPARDHRDEVNMDDRMIKWFNASGTQVEKPRPTAPTAQVHNNPFYQGKSTWNDNPLYGG
jgi:hypothetical protein